MKRVTYPAVLRALELRDARLPAGPNGRGPAYARGGADGERRDEAWADCPACGRYGLRVDRQEDGAQVSCRQGCRPPAIFAALMSSTVERRAA